MQVRAEGDPVRIEDQVTLEAMSTPGQFLHSSMSTFRDRRGVHEVSSALFLLTFFASTFSNFTIEFAT